jgi:hypothetical protein
LEESKKKWGEEAVRLLRRERELDEEETRTNGEREKLVAQMEEDIRRGSQLLKQRWEEEDKV